MTFERCECGVFDCVKFIKVEEKVRKVGKSGEQLGEVGKVVKTKNGRNWEELGMVGNGWITNMYIVYN